MVDCSILHMIGRAFTTLAVSIMGVASVAYLGTTGYAPLWLMVVFWVLYAIMIPGVVILHIRHQREAAQHRRLLRAITRLRKAMDDMTPWGIRD